MEIDAKKKRDYIYHDLTQGMCRQCRKLVDAQILFREDRVFLRSICPIHGSTEALIAESSAWYKRTMNSRQISDKPRIVSKPIEKGCPFDCGLCGWHEKTCHLPIFSITNACNLKCPICFTYNREDQTYFMSEKEFQNIIDWIIESEGQVDLINITGGEPTLHPNLMQLIRLCKRKEIGRVTLNSNGIRISKDENFVKQIGEEGVYIVLSLNTFRSETSLLMHGLDIVQEKLSALKNLEKYNVQTTLLNVMVKGVNDDEIHDIIDLMLTKDFIRSVTIQTMTYTGFGGGKFQPRRHLPIDDVINSIVKSHPMYLRHDDFTPLPGTHPLCYSVAYLFVYENMVLPLRRLFSETECEQIIGKKYLIHPDESLQDILTNKINEIWAEDEKGSEKEQKLFFLKQLIAELYPVGKKINAFERQKIAEKFIKTIYIHAHMDEDTFDVSRVVRCGDLVPDSTKTFTPACTYNLFYRMRDSRFWREDAGVC